MMTRDQLNAIECETLKRLKASHLAALDEIDNLRKASRDRVPSEMIRTKDLARITGLTTGRIRQIATTIPGAARDEAGWLFPADAADKPPFKKENDR